MKGIAPFQISSEDYYRRSEEYRAWLLKRHNVHFDQLEGAKARKYFDKFVDKWNSDRVADEIYSLASKVKVDGSNKKRTYRGSHDWGLSASRSKEVVSSPLPPPSSRTSDREVIMTKEERHVAEKRERKVTLPPPPPTKPPHMFLKRGTKENHYLASNFLQAPPTNQSSLIDTIQVFTLTHNNPKTKRHHSYGGNDSEKMRTKSLQNQIQVHTQLASRNGGKER